MVQLKVYEIDEKNATEGKVIFAKVRGKILRYRVRLPKLLQESGSYYEQLKLAYVTKRNADRQEYFFDLSLKKTTRKYVFYESIIDLEQIDFKPLNWKFTVIQKNPEGEPTEIELVNRSYLNFAKYCSLFFDNSYSFEDGMFVYPYVNGARNISLQYRKKGEYDDYHVKLKERLAVLRFIFTFPILKRKRICLVFEKYSQMAQDNGYYFFKYCMEHNMEKKMRCKFYYVITKDSPDRKKLEAYEDHILDFMSVKHIAYALAAKMLISTDAKAHVYPWRRKGCALIPFIKRKKLVFLQHGVTAMKKVDFFYGKGKGGECDLFITTSDLEKEIVLEHFGYKENQIPVTGFARWDVLEDKSQDGREILIMPTWRSWLEDFTKEEFQKSDYYKHYADLLKEERLYQILEKYNLTADFYLHPKFKEYIGSFLTESERVRIIPFGTEPLNEIMMRCRMLVTDYSSVSWDMFYQKKPVVFYQFDREDYLEVHGSYIDMDTQLFGTVARTGQELIDALEACVSGNFTLGEKQCGMHKKYFKYIDNQNSERICQAIQRELL